MQLLMWCRTFFPSRTTEYHVDRFHLKVMTYILSFLKCQNLSDTCTYAYKRGTTCQLSVYKILSHYKPKFDVYSRIFMQNCKRLFPTWNIICEIHGHFQDFRTTRTSANGANDISHGDKFHGIYLHDIGIYIYISNILVYAIICQDYQILPRLSICKE